MEKNGNGYNGRYTAAEMAEAIAEAKGFISTAAKRLGCGRRTIYRYIRQYASVRQAVEDAREDMKDFAEAKLFQLIQGYQVCTASDEEEAPRVVHYQPNVTAIIFYLKCQAKDRGYVERMQHEVTGADGGPLVVRYVDDWRNPTTEAA